MGLALSLPSLDHSALVEEVKETTALVILALRSMMYISEEEVSLGLDLVVFMRQYAYGYTGYWRGGSCKAEQRQQRVACSDRD